MNGVRHRIADIVAVGYIATLGTRRLLDQHSEDIIKRYNKRYIEQAMLSLDAVVKEPDISSISADKELLHISDGGILHCLYNYAIRRSCGMGIKLRSVPILQISIEVAEFLALDPYKLLSDAYICIVDRGDICEEELRVKGYVAACIGALYQDAPKIVMDREVPSHLNRLSKIELSSEYIAVQS